MIGGDFCEGEPGLYLKMAKIIKNIIDGKSLSTRNFAPVCRRLETSAFPSQYSAYPYNTKSNPNRIDSFSCPDLWIQRIFKYTLGVKSYA